MTPPKGTTSTEQINIAHISNRIVHGYSGINLNIVWDTISQDVPKLREELIAVKDIV